MSASRFFCGGEHRGQVILTVVLHARHAIFENMAYLSMIVFKICCILWELADMEVV
jgi:hypothetical protein